MLRVVTTDFLALGGDAILAEAAPAGGFQVEGDGPLLRDVVGDWLRAAAAGWMTPNWRGAPPRCGCCPVRAPVNCSR